MLRLSGPLACLFALLALTPVGATTATEIRLPGAPPFDAELQRRLLDGWRAHIAKPGAEPPVAINRLALESSPYLQQHATNPVNWYAWGDEAFALAQRENTPILLSIGYSTCHWCHVMAHECFQNEAIARYLNEHYVAIKVDREERPDIDAVYVEAVSRMTGNAGWPLTVLLTPSRQPFAGGTYFPPEKFLTLLTTVTDAWSGKRDEVVKMSDELTRSLRRGIDSPLSSTNLTNDTLTLARTQLGQRFDAIQGGFGKAPKFPQAHLLQFLLRYARRNDDREAQRMVEVTLDQMARGGIHDQLGGGFHRYSTDAQWKVPHFEKMLYDQAINARAYVEAYQATRDSRYATVARDVLDYVLRDMTASGGGFFSAEDADSDGEEGRYYVWSRDQIVAAVGSEQGPRVADFYGVADKTSPAPLRIPTPIDEFVREHQLDAATWTRVLTEANAKLAATRARRTRPMRDEKIIVAWNGLMISTLAYGAAVLDEPRYAAAAARAADFILTQLTRDGRLRHSFRDRPSPTPAYLDDCAALILGVTDLYAATLESRWLREADRLSRETVRRFADSTTGGLRYSADDHEPLIASNDDIYDGAMPSAQSLAATALLRVGRMTMNGELEARGRAVLTANAGALAKSPSAYAQMLIALDFALGPTKEIVIAGPPTSDTTRALLATVRKHYLPGAVVLVHAPGDVGIEELVPFLGKQTMIDGKPTAYVCENYVCKLPTTDPTVLEKRLTGR